MYCATFNKYYYFCKGLAAFIEHIEKYLSKTRFCAIMAKLEAYFLGRSLVLTPYSANGSFESGR